MEVVYIYKKSFYFILTQPPYDKFLTPLLTLLEKNYGAAIVMITLLYLENLSLNLAYLLNKPFPKLKLFINITNEMLVNIMLTIPDNSKVIIEILKVDK